MTLSKVVSDPPKRSGIKFDHVVNESPAKVDNFAKRRFRSSTIANCQYFSRWQDLVRYAVENLVSSFAMLFKVVIFLTG